MRRYLFFFAVLLSTFVTGVFSDYLLSFPPTDVRNVAVTEPIPEVPEQSVLPGNPLHHETGIDSLISDKEKALLLFEPTLKKWNNNKKIPSLIPPSPEVSERIAATRLHRYEAPYLTRRALESYKTTLLDLNKDGKYELAIQYECDTPYECELWIFRKTKNDFDVILRSSDSYEKFKPLKHKSHGFSDIESFRYTDEQNYEASKEMIYYRFDGKEYRFKGCSSYINRYRDKNGDLRYLKKPYLENYDDCRC